MEIRLRDFAEQVHYECHKFYEKVGDEPFIKDAYISTNGGLTSMVLDLTSGKLEKDFRKYSISVSIKSLGYTNEN